MTCDELTLIQEQHKTCQIQMILYLKHREHDTEVEHIVITMNGQPVQKP